MSKASGFAEWRFYKAGILETLELGRSEEAWPIVDKLDVQTLYIYGENSGEISREDLARLELNESIKTSCVKGAGHWVHFDRPGEFTSALLNFFKIFGPVNH